MEAVRGWAEEGETDRQTTRDFDTALSDARHLGILSPGAEFVHADIFST
jgi:hypothetical protein